MFNFGKMKNFGFLPLGGGCIVAAVFHFISCLLVIFSDETEHKALVISLSAILGFFIILGLVLRNFIIFYVVVVFLSCTLLYNMTILVFLILFVFSNSPVSIQKRVFVTFSVFVTILFELLFLNLYMSIINVYKAGGTGWEHKNYMEIKNEKTEQNKNKKPEDTLTIEDYNA
ncbi:conserved Plasmodium protein, unknown function [Plasmodium ovale]|uniref:Uncharacterized protein n=1 Tax=Plasmodium ovale TaxID=36330 RepID=A0A1D3TGM0_PLAOA|nr:conserved Plasmodium protein, unknown function [Plasmodium ovale]